MPDQPSDKSAQEKAKDLINQAFGHEKKDDRSFAERIQDQVAAAAEGIQQKAERQNEQEERHEAQIEQQKARLEQQHAAQQTQHAGASIQDSIAAAAKQAAETAAKARAQSAPAAPGSTDAEELAVLRNRINELEHHNPAAAAPAAAPEPRTYTVKGGDSLSKIAKNFYGDAMQWKRIYEANRDKISNPDLIHPGQVFVIPE
jgi:nucleoid-associated protein YgaU